MGCYGMPQAGGKVGVDNAVQPAAAPTTPAAGAGDNYSIYQGMSPAQVIRMNGGQLPTGFDFNAYRNAQVAGYGYDTSQAAFADAQRISDASAADNARAFGGASGFGPAPQPSAPTVPAPPAPPAAPPPPTRPATPPPSAPTPPVPPPPQYVPTTPPPGLSEPTYTAPVTTPYINIDPGKVATSNAVQPAAPNPFFRQPGASSLSRALPLCSQQLMGRPGGYPTAGMQPSTGGSDPAAALVRRLRRRSFY